jgi:hypothetical protein
MRALGLRSGGSLALPDDDAFLSALTAGVTGDDDGSSSGGGGAAVVTTAGLALADEYYASASSLADLRNADAVTFWLNAAYACLWAALAGLLAAASVVRASPRLRRQFPFVRSDYYGQIPGARNLVPFLCSAFFLSILSSLFGTLACALNPTTNDAGGGGGGDGGDDDDGDGAAKLSAELLALLDAGECFAGSHRTAAAAALLGLTFYLPSAFLVAISFLNDEQNATLDVRFVVAFEVLEAFGVRAPAEESAPGFHVGQCARAKGHATPDLK